ncbi:MULTISPECIES: chemoreceptor glutamine deamidase CheD [Pseudoalteromonas]|jgi:chemotaxis protein CheD|uniref:Probable chemoreceptor glutamine deamidase CheD n=1 Tax=Pseudoalteromonas aliena SW19 TaxID=1314866 RepID=A0ABR9E6I7_9GAMM|nr:MULTISPECIES: chemoreceptor glutamine deamidase CheD [Pseudoalteromonas]MBE0361014.1 chemotaxis protein CheD [Pseudoalteromonas aliena SW19]TMO05562.1 chemotaxis protein CheD [Pseudoalteromonas sp. S558]
MHAELRPVLPSFEHIKRYWDSGRDSVVAKVLPGEFYVSKNNELISTVLGSCIAACVYDESLGIGGMNHFMLPIQKDTDLKNAHSLSCRYGNWAMEYLINEVLKNGASRHNLKIKLFGGGKIISAMTDIGLGNISFAMAYIEEEALNLVAHDMGGPWPRKIFFHPHTGKVYMKKLRNLHNNTIEKREVRYLQNLKKQEVTTDIELF